MTGLTRAMLAAAAAGALLLRPELRAQPGNETGSYLFQRYSAKSYFASPQNWAIVQDRSGLMYFGNTDGLLEYDGAGWRIIRLPGGSAVRSLSVDSNGTVFAGGQSEIGYLRPNGSGAMRYMSLVFTIPEEDRKFGDVWSTAATPHGVFFSTSKRLFRWSGSRMKVWKTPAAFGRVFAVNGEAYVAVDGSGLHRVDGDALELVPGGQQFPHTFVRGVFQVDGKLMVLSRDGIFRQAGGVFERVPSAVEPFLKENKLYSCLPLPGGGFALGTARGGVALVDARGALQRVLNKQTGLPSDYIASIYADRQGGYWLATGEGIARFEPRLTQFDERSGIRGSVVSIARYEGTLYAGTTTGLYRMTQSPGGAKFEAVPGLQETVFTLVSTSGGLLVGALRGLYALRNGRAELLVKTAVVNDIALSIRDSDVLYTAGRNSVSLIRRDGTGWRKQADSGDIGQEFRSAVEEPDGRVWVTTRNGIVRIDFSGNPPALDRFGEKEGVPAGWKNVYRIRGQVLFATEKGLMRFSAPNNRFAPDASLGRMFADGSHAVSILREDSSGNIWVTGKGYHGVLERQTSGGFEWKALPVLESGIDEIYAMHLDPGGATWVSGAEGLLYRWQPSGINPDAGFRAVLRRVQAGTGEALYAGAGESNRALRLPYPKNALRFEFVAPFYEQEGRVEYQVHLDGSDEGWSSWSNETWRDYTNLFEHAYSFRVRARSPHGSVSEAAVFDFRILPPWYRTWWAYLFYAVLAGGAIWLVTRWRTRQLEERNRWLEGIVDERTAEVRQQRDQIQAQERKTEALLLNILPAPVADELRTTGAVQPLSFDDVTVCFTDFVGFTASSEKVAAGQLVATLHEYFTAFDEIIERYGLEKMKTIGDAYMFASGLPRTRAAHAVDAVMAALEIVHAVDRLSRRAGSLHWGIRVGLNSGPVMAGVVGVRKFAYDIWGDTVNRASRMESSGEAGRVNLSARTWSLVGDFIECESRGLVRIKGGRELEMHFANGVKPELLHDSAFARLYEERFGETPRAIAPRQSAAGA